MLPSSSVGVALSVAATPAHSGSTSGFVSILIGIVILVVTARWTWLHRQANKVSDDDPPPPPVRKLGADVDWWRENAGTPATPAPEPDPPA